MEELIGGLIGKWGVFGVLIIYAAYIVINDLKDRFGKNKDKSKDKDADCVTYKKSIVEITDMVKSNLDDLDRRMKDAENTIASLPDLIFNRVNECVKTDDHSDFINQLNIGPKLHTTLSKFRKRIGCDHIFIGLFHNGTSSLGGMPYYKYDIIAERFCPEKVEDDIELANVYKNVDIMRHDRLPMILHQSGRVHYTLNPDGSSELSDVDDIIYRRMLGRGVKQISLEVFYNANHTPEGFVGCIDFDNSPLDDTELSNCAKEIEQIFIDCREI